MPCKIQIEKNLTEEVDRMSLEGLAYPLEEAEKVAKKVNNLFNANVVRFYRIGDIVDRSINIPKSLIDKYYDNEKRLEEQEARSIQQEDAARAGVEYTDEYLFGKEEREEPSTIAKGEKALQPKTEKRKDFVILNNALSLNLSEKEIEAVYENYVNLMDRKREGKAIDRAKFDQVFKNLQVFKSKNTYIFGEWDSKNNVFKGRLMSSPGIKELYTELDVLLENVNFMASVPSDIGKMLEKKGLYKLNVDKPYNFRGEDMIKNLYFTNKDLVEKVFKKPVDKITYEEVIKYDSFFNYWSLIKKLKDAYDEKDFDKLFPLLKEIGIYDYNAYRLVKKVKRADITNEDINNVVQEVIKNSAVNRVNIDKTDLFNNPEIYNELNNELNKTLATYLSKFGIETKLLNDLQTELGIDSLAHLDILNKIIYINKNNQKDYPQQAGKIIAYMMQHNPLVQEITSNMSKLSMFKNLKKEELLEAVGDLISKELHKKTDTKVPTSLLLSIRALIRQFFDFLNEIKLQRINRNIAIIADNILIQNQSLITQSIFKPGAVGDKVSLVSLKEALSKDNFAKSIVDKLSEYFILTGSVTLAEQGTIYRPEENQVHDLDWISSFPREESVKLFESLYQDAVYIRNIKGDDYQTDTWVVPQEGYKINNLVFVENTNKIQSYDVVDKDGNIVNVYNGLMDTNSNSELAAKMIDIFSYDVVTEEKTKNIEITLESGKKLKIADWRNTFRAKLEFGRLKDIWDYNRFIPKKTEEVTPKLEEPKTPIKPGVEELFESNPELANAVYEALGIYNVWHASDKKIDKFISENVEGYFAKVKKGSPKAVFFTANKAPQESFLSKREYQEQFAVKMNNPLVVDTKTGYSRDNESFKELVDRALAGNHDGVIVKNVDDNGFVGDVYISLNANQISKITPQQKQQAQQLYSQYLESLSKPNTNPILQGSKQEQVKKFAELQERLNNKEFIERAKNAYESSKGLQELGTQKEYNDYIARVSLGIIKNPSSGEYNYTSKVKDIVYHDSNVDLKTTSFDKDKIGQNDGTVSGNGISFYSKQDKWLYQRYDKNRPYDNPSIINLINPITKKDFLKSNNSKTLEEAVKKATGQELKNISKHNKTVIDVATPLQQELNVDGIINQFIEGSEYLVFEPEQIHILGGKQDIQGFKEFVESTKPAEKAKVEVVKPTYVQGNLFEQKVNQKIEDYLATETSEDVPLEEKKPVPAETREQAIQDVVVKLKNLLTRLGITVKEFEEIYIEQQNINALTNKLQDTTLSEKERADIESQIQTLKNKGLDKRALAVADIMNRTINVSVDGKMEDLTEEVLHFIVDIIEQKDPALYKELYDKVWSYEKYKQVKKDYAGRYTTEEEFRKEAITQVLNDYLLNPLESAPESDYQNQKTESFWDKIVNKLNSLFTKTSNVDVNPFKIATEKLLRSDFITASDIQYLNSKGLFFSLKKQKSAEEIRDDLLKTSKEMSIKENKEKQPRYFKGTREIAKRVSDLVSKYYSTLFRDTDRKDYAFAEQVREEGVEIHAIFQHTFAKYVSPNGEVLSSPVAANQQLKDLTAKYPNIASKVDEVVREIIRLNPDSYFLAELMIADGYEIGGTLDLVVINKKNGRTSIYDWKTKRGKKQDKGTKSYIERTKIDWWNVNGWRIQLSEYVKILRKNGVTNIGDVRMIPIMTFEKKQNDQWKIDTIEITSFERSKVDPRKRQLLPVIGLEEKSPYETINKLTEKIRSVINQNIQKIKSDFRLKEDLEEENAVLENIYSILLATDNINSALSSLRSIIEDSKDLANQAASDLQKVNDLSDAELYQYYQRIESSLSKLKIYFENSKDGVPVFNLINMTEDIYGKTSEKIISEYEDLLTQYKEKPTEELKQKIEKQKPAYDVAISLGKINNSLGDVSRKLRQLSGNYFQRYGERKGISDIFGLDLGQSWLGKFANNIRDLYSLNFKTAQLAKSLLLKANSIIADKNKQAANAMYALRDKYLEGKGTVTNLEDLFKNLIYYNEEANDYFLIPEISDDFKKEFFKMKEEFEKGYSQDGNLFFSTPAYKKIKTWLEDNLEMAEWKKDFEKKKERQIKRFEELNSNLKTTDPEQYEVLYNTKLSKIEYYNNILTSPNAWNSLAKFKYANRKKWTSKEYLKLTDIEKEMHKKFTSIYSRAEKIGYVQGYKNYYRIPFKLKQTNLLFEKLDPSKAFIVRPEDEVYQSYTRVDPVTGVEIHEIPIRMTNYLPAKEKGKLVKSLDLFQVYLELETNLNRFEEMSNIEDILLDLIKVEQNKTEEIEVNMFGKPTGEKPEKEKAGILTTTREDILKKLIYNALYGIKYEKDIYIRTSLGSLKGTITKNPAELKEGTKYVSVKKAYEWINTYANMLFIQANLKISGAAAISSSIVAGTATSKNIQGSKYLLSLLNKINPKAKGKSYGKAFNYHLKQREIEELNLQRTETLKRLALYGKQYAVDHLRLVDEFIQNSVFDASLEKFLVINNKIVNADTYFSSLIPDQENMSYKEIKEKEAELYKKHEKDTLLNYLENNTKNGKTDISKLDKDSVYEFEQTIRLESKKIVGNSSDETIFGMRLGFVGSALMKFKSWMPELYNSFFGGIYWREEGKRFEAGRFGSFYRTVVDPIDKSNLSKDDKSLLKTMSMGVLNSLNMLFNLGFFGGKQDAINRLEERYRFYREELEELGVENIPTKKEYIDLNLQEAQNAKNFLMSVAVVYLFSNVLAILAGDDDPEEHPNTVRLFELMGLNLGEADDEILRLIFGFASSITGKGLKELYSYYDPEDTYTNLMKLGFPALGAISVGAKGVSAVPKLLFGETEDVKNIPDAIPFLRPALRTYIKYSDDEELQDLLNVDKNFRKQRKEDEQAEAWF